MKANDRQALRITHISLENWRNFSRADVDLGQRVFLVGPNASGKSNFLDSVRFLRDVVAVGGGFQAAVANRGGVGRLRCLSARQFPNIGLRIRLGTDQSPASWEYEVRFTQDKQHRARLDREQVTHNGQILLSRPDADDGQDPERLSQTYLEQVNVNQSFREVAEFLKEVRYLHVVPQLVREPDRSVGRKQDPFGGDFLEQVARTPAKTRKARLRRITEALRVAVPQLQALELRPDVRGTPHLWGKYEHWRPQGAWQSESDFSDGTLRLLGLLWATLDGAGPLLLEEPELSLHPEVVRYIPQTFARMQRRSGRQIFLSTHSTDLLQDVGIGLDEVLVLIPKGEGTAVRVGADIIEIVRLLEGGQSLADVLIPYTRPERAFQGCWPKSERRRGRFMEREAKTSFASGCEVTTTPPSSRPGSC
jgi:predicted ATPase